MNLKSNLKPILKSNLKTKEVRICLLSLVQYSFLTLPVAPPPKPDGGRKRESTIQPAWVSPLQSLEARMSDLLWANDNNDHLLSDELTWYLVHTGNALGCFKFLDQDCKVY
jgi:hypothetical protein